MKISHIDVGNRAPCFVVGEIGINHNGNLEIAKTLICEIGKAGAQAAKFQKRTLEICYTPEELARPRESPWGTTNGDQKRGLEFGEEAYRSIEWECRKQGVLFFASPWDIPSVEFLEKFDAPVYKVASAMLTDLDLLEAIGHTKKPVIISTGMSAKEEIQRAVDLFHFVHEYPLFDIALLACTSTYPAPVNELNLKRIVTLKTMYNRNPIGYSGHEISPWPSLCAVAMGAEILERHVTLDRSMYGSDQSASLEMPAFSKLVEEIRTFEIARGDGKLGIIPSEEPIREKLRRVK